ncbi:MAG TPA: hypothetical protein PKZ84_02335 [Anaerolineae bacterium]|nr:hypothetical protein [Anaerolineae bacterium]HQI83584.1 hypothetical protein [Anaerolineae bacterium]
MIHLTCSSSSTKSNNYDTYPGERIFEIVEFKPLGGTILQFLLADIAGNFRTPEGERLLEMLFAIEDALLAAEELESDFAYMVARVR